MAPVAAFAGSGIYVLYGKKHDTVGTLEADFNHIHAQPCFHYNYTAPFRIHVAAGFGHYHNLISCGLIRQHKSKGTCGSFRKGSNKKHGKK